MSKLTWHVRDDSDQQICARAEDLPDLVIALQIRPSTVSCNLFVGQRGERMTPSGVWRVVKKYAMMAGAPDLRVHDLRHTVLTRLVRELGCDLATVAKISGHRNLKTLLRYAQPTPDDLAAAVEKLAFTG